MNRDNPDLPGVRPVTATEPDASVVGLLRQLSREVPALFTKELALAKAELQASLTTLKAGIAGVAGALLLLLARAAHPHRGAARPVGGLAPMRSPHGAGVLGLKSQ